MTLWVKRSCWTMRRHSRLLLVLASSIGTAARSSFPFGSTKHTSQTSLRGATDESASDATGPSASAEPHPDWGYKQDAIELGSDGAMKQVEEPMLGDDEDYKRGAAVDGFLGADTGDGRQSFFLLQETAKKAEPRCRWIEPNGLANADEDDEIGLPPACRLPHDCLGTWNEWHDCRASTATVSLVLRDYTIKKVVPESFDDVLTIKVCDRRIKGAGAAARPSVYTYKQDNASADKIQLSTGRPEFGTRDITSPAEDNQPATQGSEWSYAIKNCPTCSIQLNYFHAGNMPGAGPQWDMAKDWICISEVRTSREVLTKVPFWLSNNQCSAEFNEIELQSKNDQDYRLLPGPPGSELGPPGYFSWRDSGRLACVHGNPPERMKHVHERGAEWGPFLNTKRDLGLTTCNNSPNMKYAVNGAIISYTNTWRWQIKVQLNFKNGLVKDETVTHAHLPNLLTSVVVTSCTPEDTECPEEGAGSANITEGALEKITLTLVNDPTEKKGFVWNDALKNKVCIASVVYGGVVVVNDSPFWLVSPKPTNFNPACNDPRPASGIPVGVALGDCGEKLVLDVKNSDVLKGTPLKGKPLQHISPLPPAAEYTTVKKTSSASVQSCDDFTAKAICEDCSAQWTEWGGCKGGS